MQFLANIFMCNCNKKNTLFCITHTCVALCIVFAYFFVVKLFFVVLLIAGRLVIWMLCHPVHQTPWYTALYQMDQFDTDVTGAPCLCLSDADTVCRLCLLCLMPRLSLFVCDPVDVIVSYLPVAMQQILVVLYFSASLLCPFSFSRF